MKTPTSSPVSFRKHLVSALCMTALLACGMASAMADTGAALPEVLLSSGDVAIPAADARLIRTSLTPSKIKLSMPIATQNTVCGETAQIPHTGQNGAQCGYDHLVREVCRDVPGVCHEIDPVTHRKACQPTRRECGQETIDQARVCTWLESECVRTDVVDGTELRTLTLKFKHVASLATGETEVYEIHGEQTRLNGTGANFSMSPITTKRSVKIISRDGPFTGFAHVIVIKGN
jgi:hypothetical protein